MIGIQLILDGYGALAEWEGRIIEGGPVKIICLADGMESGLPSVVIGIPTEHGIVCGQASARLFIVVARAIAARFPEALPENEAHSPRDG